ncbi:hypothetical protein EMPS_09857 [Entomortierella parvispora]|uniref:Crinkler effector protein N-terminal domain-containing protein n=1 Tax=Entomortierella parvispora TaxID=205924 RepID=A0A9P3M0Q0_9FUNG|nr:hypothetical protein EMPS_09857 [Entomortierella parvispora]
MATDTLTLFCLISGESTSKSFKVRIVDKDADVSDLKDDVFKVISNPSGQIKAKDLVLWKATIPVGEERIIELGSLGDKIKLDNPRTGLSKLFPESPDDNTYIVVEKPEGTATAQLEMPRLARRPSNDLMHVIKEIQDSFHPRGRGSDSAPKVSSLMPMLERPLDKAANRVIKNVINCLDSQKDEQVAKALSSFLVCSGTAGTGKTRYGQELSSYLRRHLSEKVKEKGLSYTPLQYYMLLDFYKDASLRQVESKLDAENILGLRMAYFHFFQGKYLEAYPDFYHQVADCRGLFTITNVIIAIRKDLKLPAERPFFLFLHIDEFQKIFDHRWEGTPARRRPSLSKGGIYLAGDKTEGHTEEGLSLFKDIMHTLGNFMSGASNPDIIQTFLSGTARREVTLAAKPTLYSFEFLSCPPLSLGACYDIMGSFLRPESVHACQWVPKKGILYLLSATGGLPRALQLLLEEFFGSRLENHASFLEALSNIDEDTDTIFGEVEMQLDNLYAITDFAKKHKGLICAIVRLCLLQQPVERDHVPSDLFPKYTMDVLERETHTILEDNEDNDGRILVRIPFFFLSRYNKVVEEVRNHLKKIFVEDWESSRGWSFFEGIVADFEALRTNLLFGDRQTATLREIYCGAMGQPETLDRIVKLKELSVVKLIHRFPSSGRPTVAGGEQLDWRSDKVFVNAAGASFADVFVCRESSNGNGENILFGLQAKKLTTATLTLETIKTEHKKNEEAIKGVPAGSLLDEDNIKNAKVITVLITTADINDKNFQLLNSSFPPNCLLIYQGNFTKFFGQAFSVSAALALSEDLNWNFATKDTLKKKHHLDDSEVEDILANLPYRSYDDLIQKVPTMSSKATAAEMGFFPYQYFRAEKRRRLF